MHGTERVSMRGVCGAAFLAAVLLSVTPSLGMATAYQTTGQSNPRPQPNPGIPGLDSAPADGHDPLAAGREAGRARSMANERQKKIIDDTAKLLQLATELKTDVDKTTKEEMSLDVIRKADEIERLAHDVKQRMKG
jgi:hypothetical protein